jgi:hypothetical protein
LTATKHEPYDGICWSGNNPCNLPCITRRVANTRLLGKLENKYKYLGWFGSKVPNNKFSLSIAFSSNNNNNL